MDGSVRWISCGRRRLSVGIGQDSSCTGSGSRGIALMQTGDARAGNCANSSSAWWLRTQPGRSAHSWRVEDARLRHLGENGLALDAEGPDESCVGKALVDFPERPPEVIATMDFFTVPTPTFGILHCFFLAGVFTNEKRPSRHLIPRSFEC